jgi:phenylalanine-4-hydroxylase
MFSTQESVKASLPSYLRQFVVEQHYGRYTPQDHAVWRYIMRRNLAFLSKHAHKAYLEGLEKTGISPEYIPNIDEMNEKLSKIGWSAVVVDGFVPPAAFMEFQALKVLVISADMRNIGNILYTPAPDIVHEAAGHAPIIAEPSYAAFLQRFGEVGSKAVSSRLDYEIYEAIRYLSIIKEYPLATKEEVDTAEKTLMEKLAANTNPSEATRLSRLHWWTVEYGLVGSVDDFKIYGAGLLSSVGESKHCMSAAVKKLPLTTAAADINYDITEMQPQLFVAKDFDHLMNVLEEFADTMCFRKGGAESVRTIIESGAVGTVELSSGIQISSVFSDVLTDAKGNPVYLKATGATSLSVGNKELPGHGISYHKDGFGTPVGSLLNFGKALEDCSDDDLIDLKLAPGATGTLQFKSGVVVHGKLEALTRRNGKLVLMTFNHCTVTGPDGTRLFEPSWGVFDMAVGTAVTSVYSGAADKEAYNVYPPKSDKNAIPVEHSSLDEQLFTMYRDVREMRESKKINRQRLADMLKVLDAQFQDEWLLRLEIFELDRNAAARHGLDRIAAAGGEKSGLIEAGLALL